MAEYEGKSERDILIELYLKMQQLEHDIQELNNNFSEYKKQKSIRLAALQVKHDVDFEKLNKKIEALEIWKSETVGTWKGITIFATILGVLGTILGGIAVFIL